jgi:hypothetical protein
MSKNQSGRGNKPRHSPATGNKSPRSPPNVTWEHSWSADATENALAQSNFRALPNEVMLHIFKYLTVHDLGHISLVCRSFKMLADQDEIWKLKTKCNFICSFYIKLI